MQKCRMHLPHNESYEHLEENIDTIIYNTDTGKTFLRKTPRLKIENIKLTHEFKEFLKYKEDNQLNKYTSYRLLHISQRINR